MTITDIRRTLSRRSRRTEQVARALPLVIGGVRAGLGVSYLIAPTLSHRLTAGDDAALPSMRTTARLFGAREIFVGTGVLVARNSDRAVLRNAIEAGVVLDVVDAVTFAATSGSPARSRVLGTAAAAGFALLGAYTALLLAD